MRSLLLVSLTASFCISLQAGAAPPQAAPWKPADGPLFTRWAKDVSPDKVHPEYPRPQMVRKEWKNLNGLWEYAIREKGDTPPDKYDGRILVPFPVESALSGVMKQVGPDKQLWYRRTADVSRPKDGRRWLMHFGAVDWRATVFVNGKKIGTHEGGYDPFTFDITPALKDAGEQEIVVSVWDPTDRGPQPRGKQVVKPHSIWYTPTTGIWQTVWLEQVPKAYIESLKITPDVDRGEVRITVKAVGAQAGHSVLVQSRGKPDPASGRPAPTSATGPHDKELSIQVKNARLWSPEDPFLYEVEVLLLNPLAYSAAEDRVATYFGMRKTSLGKDKDGITRLMLNNKPVFQFGPLDQGFWPDGLYTAPTDEALRYDIEMTRKLGFNMCRKHVKVEPARWYYWCDKLGLLVWQDMPNGDAHVASGKGEIRRSPESAKTYELELQQLIDTHFNHPCIVMWVPFNEGWGQFDTERIVRWIKQRDPTRLVNCASGWNDIPGVGDVHDIHIYPGPGSPKPGPSRAAVLGEFGGLGLPLKGHTWQDEKNWGYRSYKTPEELTDAYVDLIRRLRPLIRSPGLSAAIYTQTTDVEIEVNGLLTYDRALVKPDEKRLTQANRSVYLPPPIVKPVAPTSQKEGIEWRYTTKKPADDWHKPAFLDSAWEKGPGGFGTKGTPGAVVRTEWKTPDIWLRRSFKLEEATTDHLYLLMHHDEDADVYINGQLAAKVTGYTTDYVTYPLSKEARATLQRGVNTLAVHCKQTGGGQYIDVGLVEVVEVERGRK